jgi:hypothetical protein
MPEEKQDPANTQMFRAFVERGEQDTDRSPRTVLLVVAAVVVVALIALIIVFAVS